jgi:hypothetical protein
MTPVAVTAMAAMDAVGLLAAALSLILVWRQRILHDRRSTRLRETIESGQEECLRQINAIAGELTAAEKNAQASLDLLRDGRLGTPVRARALRMLRSGMAADTAAAELGLGRNEVRLLEKVAGLLAPQN